MSRPDQHTLRGLALLILCAAGSSGCEALINLPDGDPQLTPTGQPCQSDTMCMGDAVCDDGECTPCFVTLGSERISLGNSQGGNQFAITADEDGTSLTLGWYADNPGSVAFDLIRQAKPDVVGEGANVKRWLDAIGARPAVQRGMEVPKV